MKKTYFFELILILLLTTVAYGYFSSNTDWNTNSRLAMVKSVVEENRFEIDSYHIGVLETNDKAQIGDHFYSDKAIGATLIGIEFYYPFYKLFTLLGRQVSDRIFIKLISFLTISFLSAFLAPFLYSFVKQISNSAWFSFLVTFSICLGTPLYKYSTLFYSHSLVGMFLFTVFFIWFCIKGEEKISLTKVFISGYLLGYTVITEYPTVVIVLGIGCYILYVLWKKKALSDRKIYISLGLGLVIPISLMLIYNTIVFHGPFKTGYSYEVLPVFLEGQQGGLMGIGWPNLNSLFYMTFHTTMGVFWQAPVLLLAFWGWFRMWQSSTHRAEATFSFGVVFVYFLMMSGYFIWWGGSAFTPRNVIPVFPFFGIPLAFLLKKGEKFFVIILGLVSIVQMFIVAVASNEGIGPIAENMLITSFSTMFQQASMIYSVYVPNFINQFFGVNRGNEIFHLVGFQSLIPFFLIEICLVIAFCVVLFIKRNEAAQQLSEH